MTNVGDEVTVHFPVWAEYTVRVEVTEEMLDEEGDIDYENVIEDAYNNIPSGLCHGCSTGNSGIGWGESAPIYLELGEDPEPHYILGPDGKAVWGDPDEKLGW